MDGTSRSTGSRVAALTRHWLFLFAVVFAGYAVGSQLAFSWFGADGTNASFFPAAGVTLGALVLVQRRRWPVVLLAAGLAELTLDLYHDIDLVPTLGYVAANLIQPLVGALLLGATVRRADISRTFDLVAFLAFAVVVACAVGGAIGASTFVFLDGGSGWARFAGDWWVGDGLGVLVLGSAIIALGTPSAERLSAVRLATGFLLACGTVIATQLVFRYEKFAFVYVPIVLLAALAFRIGTRGVAVTGAAIAIVAAESTAEGSRYWETLEISAPTGLLYLQLALGVLVASALALAAEIAQRERTALALARTDAEREAALERVALYEAERVARARAQLLERNAAHLAAAATEEEVASSTRDDLTTSGIPIVAVERLCHDEEREWVSVLAISGLPAEIVTAFADYPIDTDTPGAEAIRTNRAVEIASGEEYDERFPGTAAHRQQQETQSVFAVPMRSAAGEVLGAVSGAAPEPDWFDETRRALVTAVAEQTGLALERASLLEREREARSRAELDEQHAVRLQHVTAALAAAETAQDVAQVVVTQLIGAVGGMGGSLFVVDSEAATLRMVDHASYPEDVIDAYREIPLGRRLPPTDAIRSGEPVLIPDLDAFRSAYPDVVAEVGLGDPAYGGAWAHVPLFVGSRAVGMLVMAYAEPQRFDRRQIDALVSVCDAVAQALHRAELYEAEREARLRAELLRTHASRLAAAPTAGDVARTTLDCLETVDVASAWVQLVRGRTLEVLESSGVPEVNLERYRRYPYESAATPTAEAVRTGMVVETATGGEHDARFPESAPGRENLGYETLVSVPLVGTGGRTLGVLTFTSLEAHWLDESRRLLVMGLAEQCGLALERAELQAEADEAAADAALLAHLGEVLERLTGTGERAEALVQALVEDRAAVAVVHSLDDAGAPHVLAQAGDGEAADTGRLLGLATAALAEDGLTADETGDVHFFAVPLRARNRALGALTIGLPAHATSPLSTVMTQRVATRAALALDNALLYEQERDVSHSLQMGLLGAAPTAAPDTVVATAYLPGTATLEVGGDWYDQFSLPDGRLALLVGDVVGHGLEAAVAMGQLRGAVRALAPVGSPREVLERLDGLVDTLPEAAMATLAYAVLDTDEGTITYACAGHPPPLVVRAGRDPRLLWDGRSAPLGSSFGGAREEAVDHLEPGDTIVLYTDGLVERRTDGLSAGLDRLVRCVGEADDAQPAELVESILASCLADGAQEDDVCILAVRRAPHDARFLHEFPAAPAEIVRMRRALTTWLEGLDADDETRRNTVLAVTEAAANAAEHAYGFDGLGLVRVEAWSSNGELMTSVEDAGTWREPTLGSERGRGRTMMQALMDDVTIDSGAGGTTVRMRVPARRKAEA